MMSGIFGKYTLSENILGEGTYAKVKLGNDIETGKDVAIKIISKYKVLPLEKGGYFESEIEILKTLDHPCIPKFHGHFEDSANHYLVFDKIEGKELFDILEQGGPIEEHKARRIFLKLLDIVEYLHSQNICHRDIKIENIMLSEDFEKVYLIDFGFSWKVHNGEKLKQWCGTDSVAPPEVLLKKEYDGCKYDIWSLGNVLYLMLKARFAFRTTDYYETRENIVKGNIIDLDSFPENIASLLRYIFQVDYTLRPIISEIKSHMWLSAIL